MNKLSTILCFTVLNAWLHVAGSPAPGIASRDMDDIHADIQKVRQEINALAKKHDYIRDYLEDDKEMQPLYKKELQLKQQLAITKESNAQKELKKQLSQLEDEIGKQEVGRGANLFYVPLFNRSKEKIVKQFLKLIEQEKKLVLEYTNARQSIENSRARTTSRSSNSDLQTISP